MKFILALVSILAVFTLATAAHAQNRMHHYSYICATEVSFNLISQVPDQAQAQEQINNAVRHFIMATGKSNSLRLQIRTQEQVQKNQLVVEFSLLDSARGASEVALQEIGRLVSLIEPSALANVSLNTTFKSCYPLAGSQL